MNWTNEPATENQLSHRRQFGYEPDHRLMKGEAAHLIQDFEQHPERQNAWAETGIRETTKHEAQRLRAEVEEARRAVAQADPDRRDALEHDFALAVARRQEFWMDTGRDPTEMRARSAQVFDLYMKHGCRFFAPGREQVQETLEALDSAMACWESERPELFYQTVELNFRELLRHGL
jgi:hypothetical protein